jgi:hypothetical protein
MWDRKRCSRSELWRFSRKGVDAVTWFVIGICQYAYYKRTIPSFKMAFKVFSFLKLGNLINICYVPLSGNWADEYITDGYVCSDQLLR